MSTELNTSQQLVPTRQLCACVEERGLKGICKKDGLKMIPLSNLGDLSPSN